MISKCRKRRKKQKLKNYLKQKKLAQENIVNLVNISLSMRMFLLGITIGVIGNLLASYVVEFHLLIMGGDSFWGLLIGIIAFGFALTYSERKFRSRLKPLEIAISKLETAKKMLAQEREKSKHQ